MLLVWTIIALVAFPSGILSASPQFCGNSFGPSLKVKNHHYCTNPDGRAYLCRTDSCGNVKSFTFRHCVEYAPNGGVGDYDTDPIYFISFTAFPQQRYLDAIGYNTGRRYRCGWNDENTVNERRPGKLLST
ncbi:hypothetical protein MJO28_007607 [Puccinia striiformis f. sp. tritici]|uniref:Uncharacterized protein n=1 Tax=Puccinia striiformis f. sp. tritici TaxID=168172 RepID=A0ACC0EGK6_9BASI|nr:hypothetical protein MJO28_007607 [Puccinia striiformis f. sp. tritici]